MKYFLLFLADIENLFCFANENLFTKMFDQPRIETLLEVKYFEKNLFICSTVELQQNAFRNSKKFYKI